MSTRQAPAQPNGHVARRISYILGCNAPLVCLVPRRVMEPVPMLNPTPGRFIGQNWRHAGLFARHVPFALGFVARQLGSLYVGSWRPLGCLTISPADSSRRMNTRQGHLPLDCGTKSLRPVAFSAEAWKPLHPLNWGAVLAPLACERGRHYPPDPHAARRVGRMYGYGFDGREEMFCKKLWLQKCNQSHRQPRGNYATIFPKGVLK